MSKTAKESARAATKKELTATYEFKERTAKGNKCRYDLQSGDKDIATRAMYFEAKTFPVGKEPETVEVTVRW